MLKLGGQGNKLVHAFFMRVQGIYFNVYVNLKIKTNSVSFFVKFLIVQSIHLQGAAFASSLALIFIFNFKNQSIFILT